jgi:hypothetical protein
MEIVSHTWTVKHLSIHTTFYLLYFCVSVSSIRTFSLDILLTIIHSLHVLASHSHESTQASSSFCEVAGQIPCGVCGCQSRLAASFIWFHPVSPLDLFLFRECLDLNYEQTIQFMSGVHCSKFFNSGFHFY